MFKHKNINQLTKEDSIYYSKTPGSDMNKQELLEVGFLRGANTILREIEKSLNLGEPPYLISIEQSYYLTLKKIKELKNE